MPLLLLLSLYLLLFGHNVPGGGFEGGLVAAAAFALFTIAHGVDRARRLLHVNPRSLVGSGLLLTLLSGTLSFFVSEPFLTSQWSALNFPGKWKAGTPLLFDIGVYLVVIGATLAIIFSLAED